MGLPRRLLHMGLFAIALAYSYTLYTRNKSFQVYSAEQAIMDSWVKTIEAPSVQFSKMVVGINSNVDLIVPGTFLLGAVDAEPGKASDHEVIDSVSDFQAVFAHFFAKGAPAERYTANSDVFRQLTDKAAKLRNVELSVGGNAAIMAQKIASSYNNKEVVLVGPIGPRLKALLHPNVKTRNSTKISKDEIHIIMEYRQGEIWGEYVSPSSSRFITSHDTLSSSAIVMDMFFNTIHNFKPDLVILSGMHLLDVQSRELWEEKLKTMKRNLNQLSHQIPIHLELGSMADREYAKNLLHRIVPLVDSLALNEQELTFMAKIGGGPHGDLYPPVAGTLHAHKVTDMLFWLMENFGRDKSHKDPKFHSFRLERIHFHCLTYHMIVTRGPDWSNSASAIAAGARLAGLHACGSNPNVGMSADSVELRLGSNFVLDKATDRQYHFSPHNPLSSWMRDNVLFVFSPVLVCKHPTKTVGLGDMISATGLMYSQFYRFGN